MGDRLWYTTGAPRRQTVEGSDGQTDLSGPAKPSYLPTQVSVGRAQDAEEQNLGRSCHERLPVLGNLSKAPTSKAIPAQPHSLVSRSPLLFPLQHFLRLTASRKRPARCHGAFHDQQGQVARREILSDERAGRTPWTFTPTKMSPRRCLILAEQRVEKILIRREIMLTMVVIVYIPDSPNCRMHPY
ncbi:hypothetical protein PGTUg99_005710 [Puccinia graminis f. sp. tritici]|uniref:Uncharacterized protein n=1 Tax=Puccinia graminis f. sp. tritici TaxID=56615 RepID=A0A5B0M233_PUCGR|nr:hypothetical protein PGTUg99_005710 [Puccinia graminis f. sp. tritici]